MLLCIVKHFTIYSHSVIHVCYPLLANTLSNYDVAMDTPGVKKKRPNKRLCWRCEIKWAAKALAFDRVNSFGHDNLTTKYCYFRCSPDIYGNKILIKMTRLQNIKIKEQCLAAWSSLSKIWSHQHQEVLNTWNKSVL